MELIILHRAGVYFQNKKASTNYPGCFRLRSAINDSISNLEHFFSTCQYPNFWYTLRMKKWIVGIFNSYFVPFFPYVVVFVSSLFNTADSDLGWHLKYGEYFFKNQQILTTNIFSSDMVGFPWVNSSWATDLLTYTVFSRFGFYGLTLLGGLVITLIFYLFARAARLSFWEKAIIFPLLIYLEEPLLVISFRGQLLTLLAFGALFYIFSRFLEGRKKMIFLAIPLFILWSNFHGEFILGIAVFSALILFYLWGKFIKKGFWDKITRQETLYLGTVLMIAFTTTLINPFGIGVYQETVKHFGNPLQKYIIEWLPFDMLTTYWWNQVIWGLFILINLFVIYTRKVVAKNIHFIAPLLILYALSFWMRRYNWPMYLISVPVVKNLIDLVRPADKRIEKFTASVIFISLYFYAVLVKNPNAQFPLMSWTRYCQFVSCSEESAKFLIKNNLTKNLLTFYNWGGWLIWNYPDIKPSIDGRMHLWQDDRGYSAFAKYYAFEQNWKDVDKSEYDTVYFTPNKPLFKQMIKLVEEKKWKIIYQDNYSAIFIRIKNGSAPKV